MKTLIITRHAHRDVTDRSQDNGLSKKGRDQAEQLKINLLKEAALSSIPKNSLLLLSSPKLRCLETLEPLSRHLGVGIQIDPRLDEQNERESKEVFLKRLQTFHEWGQKQSSSMTVIICSHGDWIPEFTGRYFGRSIDLEKGGSAIF